MAFKITDDRVFKIPGNEHMLHLGTIKDGLHEYIVLQCIAGPKQGNTYIEEVVLNTVDWTTDVTANCQFIEDDNLVNDITEFAKDKKLLDVEEVMARMIHFGVTP
jgi:hypothetical protein